ncbi:MAG TPA: hypothetical protein VEJ18_13320, partial [Planctomycetota bacterium]|nr:hypothetical protein [Planctomycetota bacterium]
LRRATPEGETVHALPPAEAPPPPERIALPDPGRPEGPLERPGYRATEMPRPRTAAGEDLVMPGAIACDPRDGRVFVASMKRGEIFVLKPDGPPVFEDYARGLFQEAYSMKAEADALYVLHRRHLSALRDTDGDGRADRVDQVARLPQAAGEVYDYGYGLVRDRSGAFLASFAPHGNRKIPGSGSLVRLGKDGALEELAWGFRNPIGWCTDAAGEVYFTDNQGEWVATNKLCHVVPGRFYGYPNSDQRHHDRKPHARTAVWVPYAWARSINGATCDTSGGKFGPFDGQMFLAELMYGGAIVRAQVEHVNGQAQGACFPFWGRGLLGPVTLAFDPKGRLWVGSITEPGWMAQPDRGGVYRIDFTGDVPFEIRSIHVRPRGFRLVFTRPVDPPAASNIASYVVDHHRYEYTGAYGSPELDRTPAPAEAVALSPDGLSVELTLPPLVKDRVYMISAPGVRSSEGEPLVHPTGAYTLHETPQD